MSPPIDKNPGLTGDRSWNPCFAMSEAAIETPESPDVALCAGNETGEIADWLFLSQQHKACGQLLFSNARCVIISSTFGLKMSILKKSG